MDDVRALNNIPMTAPDLSRFRPGEKNRTEEASASVEVAHSAARRRVVSLRFSQMLMFVLVMGAMLYIVFNYMNLSELNTQNAKLVQELAQLTKANDAMQKTLDADLNLRDLERYAVEELGMVRPTQEDIIYLDLSGSDHAVVMPRRTAWDSLRSALSNLTITVKEYLG